MDPESTIIPPELPMKAAELQMKLVQATLSGDQAAGAQLNQEYQALMKTMDEAMHQNMAKLGYVRIDPARDAEVVSLLDRWDQCLAEGRIQNAEQLIPESGTKLQTYRHFHEVFGNERMTRHPSLRTGEGISRSLEYEYGMEGALSYSLYTDGNPSDYKAGFGYEPNGKGFHLKLHGINY
jgi:hypothetical protein